MGKRKVKSKSTVTFFRSIRYKIVYCILLPVCFIIILGIVSYQKAATGLRSSYKTAAMQSLSMTSNYFSFIFQTTRSDFNSVMVDEENIAYLRGVYDGLSLQKKTISFNRIETFNKELLSAPFAKQIYLLANNGNSICPTKLKDDNMFDVIANTEQGALAATDPSRFFWFGEMSNIDEAMNTTASNYAIRMIRKYKGIDAYLVVDLKRETIEGILGALDMGENSNLSLVTQDGYEISKAEEQDKFVEYENLQFYQEAITSGEEAIAKEVDYNDSKYLYLFYSIEGTGASINALIPMKHVMEQASDIRSITVAIVILASILACSLGLFIANSIGHTVKIIINQIEKVAQGDLTVTIATKRKDEFGVLCLKISDMILHMKHLIMKVEDTTNHLTNAANEVLMTSEGFVQSAENIKIATTEIEEGINQQVEDSLLSVEQMDSLSTKIELVNSNTGKMNEIAITTGNAIKHGISYMDTIHNKTRATTKITAEVIHIIERLEEKSRSISNVVNVINEIAEQTNLLSLNASIEVARAGAAGRGFGVVADEIRKMAEQSLASAKKIDDIISEIQENTKQAVQVTKSADHIVKEQELFVNDAAKSFHDMEQHIHRLSSELGEILDNVTNMEGLRLTTLDSIRNISAVSEETAASSSSLSGIATGQFDDVTELRNMSQKLNRYSKELKESIQQFIIR